MTLLAAVIEDHLGYLISAWGGRPLIRRIEQCFGGTAILERTSTAMQRWGWGAVFFSRWLLTPWRFPVTGPAA